MKRSGRPPCDQRRSTRGDVEEGTGAVWEIVEGSRLYIYKEDRGIIILIGK